MLRLCDKLDGIGKTPFDRNRFFESFFAVRLDCADVRRVSKEEFAACAFKVGAQLSSSV
jgi:hypothetical protein